MSSVVDTLVEMGFSKERAELAVNRTGGSDVQIAMDWLLSHEEDLETAQPTPETVAELLQPYELKQLKKVLRHQFQAAASPIAKSIQCDDCGKLFQTNEEVEFHASKTGHENFSESTEEKKPLTEQEKKEQLAKIEAKLRQRRLEREAREKEEALLKEKIRIKSGKELLEAKKKHDELEMKRSSNRGSGRRKKNGWPDRECGIKSNRTSSRGKPSSGAPSIVKFRRLQSYNRPPLNLPPITPRPNSKLGSQWLGPRANVRRKGTALCGLDCTLKCRGKM
ncbi:hypothetical protein NQ318_010477 [Aromia moschata]|uniref:UBA domain-containing protein n=1 Tax=Aromia moschata TaxID=1265417 RepID=A0AAV8YAX3_9CUCU|nr:hypothetical protein NQ318_010477 [Aromia moschata]